MILLTAIALTVLFVSPLLQRRAAGCRDLLRPESIVSLLHCITVLPYLYLLAIDTNQLPNDLKRMLASPAESIAWYGVAQAVVFVSILMGLRSRIIHGFVDHLPSLPAVVDQRFLGCTALVLGVAAYLTYVQQIGGMATLVFNEDTKASLAAGKGYILAGINLCPLAVLILVSSYRSSKTPLGLALIVGAFLSSLTIFLTMGGRKPVIHLLLFSIMAWHYRVRRFLRVPSIAYFLPFVLVPYFIAAPIIRQPGSAQRYFNNPESLIQEIRDNASIAVKQLSYLDTYLFVMQYFAEHERWHGRTYADLFVAPLPRSIYPDKPPVDDGVYVATLRSGRFAEPGMPFRRLSQTSNPPETLGAAFMHFSWWGLVPLSVLLGAVYGGAYRFAERHGFSVPAVYIYGITLTNFHFTNLRIVSWLTYVGVLLIFFSVAANLVPTSRRHIRNIAAAPPR